MMKNEDNNIFELLHPTDYSQAMDLRGKSIGDSCICGGNIFHALVAFENSEITFYFLDGECANCGSLVTLPYPDYQTDEVKDVEKH